eukprot:927121-Rhodomonas_salina.2
MSTTVPCNLSTVCTRFRVFDFAWCAQGRVWRADVCAYGAPIAATMCGRIRVCYCGMRDAAVLTYGRMVRPDDLHSDEAAQVCSHL